MTKQPIKYTKEYLDKIIHKEIEIGIGDTDSDEVTFTFKGKMISFSLGFDETDVPTDFYFHTDYGSIKHFDFAYLKSIRVL